MARCVDYKTGERCPAFYEVKTSGVIPTGGGWENRVIDGKDMICCRPGTTVQKKKPMDLYCYYCTATPRSKKIGSKASFSGSTPKWCPLGRGSK